MDHQEVPLIVYLYDLTVTKLEAQESTGRLRQFISDGLNYCGYIRSHDHTNMYP